MLLWLSHTDVCSAMAEQGVDSSAFTIGRGSCRTLTCALQWLNKVLIVRLSQLGAGAVAH
jgi:hypothetical protein